MTEVGMAEIPFMKSTVSQSRGYVNYNIAKPNVLVGGDRPNEVELASAEIRAVLAEAAARDG
jgi:hypothetical protein